jgi:hypothetical protein
MPNALWSPKWKFKTHRLIHPKFKTLSHITMNNEPSHYKSFFQTILKSQFNFRG